MEFMCSRCGWVVQKVVYGLACGCTIVRLLHGGEPHPPEQFVPPPPSGQSWQVATTSTSASPNVTFGSQFS